MKKLLITCSFILLLYFYGYAQDANNIKTTAVKVTATKVEKELLEVPSSVSIVTAEDIKKSSARTVGELLQDVPGVQISNSGG